MAHLVVIGGGARSGKSAFAERRAAAHTGERRFLATCIAFDDEMRARVAAHQRDRGDAFVTVEVPDALEAALDASHHASVVVIDCLTLWLTNLLLADLSDEAIAARVGLTPGQIDEMYQILAIANYEDRFVIPTAHRELGEDAYDIRGSCGFSFGNGCSGGTSEPNLFGTPKRAKTPMEVR